MDIVRPDDRFAARMAFLQQPADVFGVESVATVLALRCCFWRARGFKALCGVSLHVADSAIQERGVVCAPDGFEVTRLRSNKLAQTAGRSCEVFKICYGCKACSETSSTGIHCGNRMSIGLFLRGGVTQGCGE